MSWSIITRHLKGLRNFRHIHIHAHLKTTQPWCYQWTPWLEPLTDHQQPQHIKILFINQWIRILCYIFLYYPHTSARSVTMERLMLSVCPCKIMSQNTNMNTYIDGTDVPENKPQLGGVIKRWYQHRGRPMIKRAHIRGTQLWKIWLWSGGMSMNVSWNKGTTFVIGTSAIHSLRFHFDKNNSHLLDIKLTSAQKFLFRKSCKRFSFFQID